MTFRLPLSETSHVLNCSLHDGVLSCFPSNTNDQLSALSPQLKKGLHLLGFAGRDDELQAES